MNDTLHRRPDLSRLLAPRAVAVVGASSNPKSLSGQPLTHMLARGYQGQLYPVNPNRAKVQGLKAYSDVLSVPRPCDVAVIGLPAPHVALALEQCGEAGIPFALVISAGFAEAGETGRKMQFRVSPAQAASTSPLAAALLPTSFEKRGTRHRGAHKRVSCPRHSPRRTR